MMDRVLSYQTAIRANSDASGFDIRQYVNKRTCISLTMSIAFITLIFGFLLGKFTSDRNHFIKESNYKRQQEVTHRPQITQNEVDILISSVINAAQEKLSTNSFKEQYFKEDGAKNFVSSLGGNFTTCLNEFSFDHNEEDLEDFLKHLLENSYKLYVKCVKELRSNLLNE